MFLPGGRYHPRGWIVSQELIGRDGNRGFVVVFTTRPRGKSLKSWGLQITSLGCCCCCSSSSSSSFFKWYLLPHLYCVPQSFLIALGGRWSNFICVFLTTLKRKSHESHEASEAQQFRLDFVWKKSNCNEQWCGKTARKMKDPVAQGGMHFLVRVWSFRSMTNFFGPLAIMNCLIFFLSFSPVKQVDCNDYDFWTQLEFLNLSVEPVFFLKRRISGVD